MARDRRTLDRQLRQQTKQARDATACLERLEQESPWETDESECYRQAVVAYCQAWRTAAATFEALQSRLSAEPDA